MHVVFEKDNESFHDVCAVATVVLLYINPEDGMFNGEKQK